MPTGILTVAPTHSDWVARLVPVLPGLIAPHFNIEGTKLHEGGVSENEIIIRLQKGSEYDCNAPDLNLFMRAHQFEGRVEQCQNNSQLIHNAIRAELDAVDRRDVSLSVEIIICELGYASSNSGKEN